MYIFLKKRAFLFLVVLVFVLLGCEGASTTFEEQEAPIALMEQEVLRERLEEVPIDIRVIDVRPSAEYREGHIPHALSMDYDAGHFVAHYEELSFSAETVIVVVDTHEHRALDAARLLRASGFTAVYVLQEGFSRWEEQGFPLE